MRIEFSSASKVEQGPVDSVLLSGYVKVPGLFLSEVITLGITTL